MIPIFDYKTQPEEVKERLLSRSQTADESVQGAVRAVLDAVQKRGDEALLEYTEKFDGVSMAAENLRVSEQEIRQAYEQVDEQLLAVIRRAMDNIRAFHQKQKQNSWMDFDGNKAMGQMVRPIENVGVYVPGGTAAYPSSVLMNIIPAKVAGVSRIVMATPPQKDGSLYAPTVVAACEAGADEIYKVGGAQAIGALAYGTKTIRRVDKITGPGNVYVACAKREVFGVVGIDMIAGPSEVLIIADESADAACVAADLLSQAEHDLLAASVLLTTSKSLAEAVRREVQEQLEKLERRKIAEKSVTAHGAIVLVESLHEAVALSDQIAPEHLELAVEDPFPLLGFVKNAGSIFLGHYSPEPLGDYYAGPNHVLPTSGTARFSSGLTVDDFIKKSSVLYYGRSALEDAREDVVRFAGSEGLTAHANAINLRFKEE
ncbi:MAG: histidinol dehydrogenase [Christensenellales bacterium]|jgi:histidinol dehydrogenase